MKKIFKGDGSTFSAKREAEEWLKSNGYSYGSSSIDGPQGVVKGLDIYISKWRGMTNKEHKDLDGTLSAGREGNAVLLIKDSVYYSREGMCDDPNCVSCDPMSLEINLK